MITSSRFGVFVPPTFASPATDAAGSVISDVTPTSREACPRLHTSSVMLGTRLTRRCGGLGRERAAGVVDLRRQTPRSAPSGLMPRRDWRRVRAASQPLRRSQSSTPLYQRRPRHGRAGCVRRAQTTRGRSARRRAASPDVSGAAGPQPRPLDGALIAAAGQVAAAQRVGGCAGRPCCLRIRGRGDPLPSADRPRPRRRPTTHVASRDARRGDTNGSESAQRRGAVACAPAPSSSPR